MTVKDVAEIYEYGHWANRRLFRVMSDLTPEEFTRSVAGSYGSVRNTLVHMLSAEWGWIERCGGAPRGGRLNPDDYPTLDGVTRAWDTVEGHASSLLSRLSDADMDRPVEFSIDGKTRYTLAMGELLRHGAIHGIHHRGQVTLLLRMLGRVPGNVDFLFYDGEKHGLTGAF